MLCDLLSLSVAQRSEALKRSRFRRTTASIRRSWSTDGLASLPDLTKRTAALSKRTLTLKLTLYKVI